MYKHIFINQCDLQRLSDHTQYKALSFRMNGLSILSYSMAPYDSLFIFSSQLLSNDNYAALLCVIAYSSIPIYLTYITAHNSLQSRSLLNDSAMVAVLGPIMVAMARCNVRPLCLCC